jgi:TPR repeat protein
MYATGEGVTQDYNEALKWYTKAAEQGYAAAQHNLGKMYWNGHGVPEDFVQSYKWLNLAAAQGNETAKEGRDALRTLMTLSQVAEAQRMSSEFRPNTKK